MQMKSTILNLFLLGMFVLPSHSRMTLKMSQSDETSIHRGDQFQRASKTLPKPTLTLVRPFQLGQAVKRKFSPSPIKCYVGALSGIALADLLFWIVWKFDSESLSLISDRFICLQPWCEGKNIRKFLSRLFLYSLGHGNVFHFIGKERVCFPN